MTLKQAFILWSINPQNVVLSANNRSAVQKVLMKKYNDVDLETFTPGFTEHLFTQCSEPQELKSKAASILVHILKWGHEKGCCREPSFTYEIAKPKYEPRRVPRAANAKPLYEISGRAMYEDEEPIVKVKPEALEKRKEELKQRDMEKKTRGRQPKAVVQIDTKTLQPIKTFKSMSDAEKETKAHNIDRAISRSGIAGGFFWCYAGEESDFKPNKASLPQVEAERKKKEKKASSEAENKPEPKPYGMSPEMNTVYLKDITLFTNDELVAEMKRRGWKGHVEFVTKLEL